MSFWGDAASRGPGLASGKMTTPSLTSFPVAFQWLNQSHNACVNYANRNATKVSVTALDSVVGSAGVTQLSSLQCDILPSLVLSIAFL